MKKNYNWVKYYSLMDKTFSNLSDIINTQSFKLIKRCRIDKWPGFFFKLRLCSHSYLQVGLLMFSK